MRFSIEAEQSVIGALLIDPLKLDDVMEIISGDDFYNPNHKMIFNSIVDLGSKGVTADVVTLSEEMHSAGNLEQCGGLGYLVEIANNTPTSHNVKAYSRIVCDRAIERRIEESGGRITELGADEAINVDDKLAMLHAEISGLERKDDAGIVCFDTLLKNRITEIDGKFRNTVPRGLMTGFKDLDERYAGIGSSALWVLAARPGQGKTALAMNIAKNVVLGGSEVIVFTMEMDKNELTDRLLSSTCGINSQKIRSGQLTEEDWPKLSAGVQQLKGMKIHIIDIPALDIHRAKAIARKFKRFGKIGLIVVDYLQLMTNNKEKDRLQVVSSVSRELKVMAKTMGCPVLALSQLNRGVESRADKRPGLSDLRESGQIEQDADIISFIYRDEYYNKDSPYPGVAEIITGKFREGEVGTDLLNTELQFARFTNYAGPKFEAQAQIEAPKKRLGFSDKDGY